MKKTLAILMTLTLIFACSATAFAAPENTSGTRPSVEGEGRDRPHSIDNLYETYYPEGIETHSSLVAEHEAFHTSRDAIKAEHQAQVEADKAEIKAEVDAIRSDLEAGLISEEEAQALMGAIRSDIEAKKAELDALRAELEVILAEKQAANDALKAQREANRAAIIAALQSNPVDGDAIASALASGLDLLRQHIDLDYYYADQIDAILGSY